MLSTEFNRQYPYLKIVIFGAHGDKWQKKIGDEYRLPLRGVRMDFIGDRTDAQLKKVFDDLQLVAFVYRRAGNSWVETSQTEHWTLEQQNREGAQMHQIHNH